MKNGVELVVAGGGVGRILGGSMARMMGGEYMVFSSLLT
jgi:hypothetical protein